MELLVERLWNRPEKGYCVSRFSIDGSVVCNVLEDQDRGLTQDMTLEEIKKKKVYGETAIPKGRYRVTFEPSARFGKSSYAIDGKIPLINNVKGFSAIRVHAGNTKDSTEGCLLLGKNDVVGKVTNSQYWCKKVFERMWLAWSNGSPIWLTIN